MAGQGRNADGLTGSDLHDAVNVVPFPGDWFGPLGDLVPIGTDADSEREHQEGYGDEPGMVGADSFWSEDAEAAHRVGRPAPVSRRRLRPLWLALPIGAVATVTVVLGVVLSSGTPLRGSGPAVHDHPARPATARLAAAPHVSASRLITGSAEPAIRGPAKSAIRGPAKSAIRGPAKSAIRDRERVERIAVTRHAADHRSLLPAAAGPREELAATGPSAEVAASSESGDLVSPTGPVSPPPNATQANP